jgi:hypothetical protein
MVRDELLNEMEPSYNQMAAQDDMECSHCEMAKFDAGAFELVVFLYGHADPLAFCSWGCLARYALDRCGFLDDSGDPL